jgi:RNA 2',3'-cyclic 3'-phosphodiesterase
LIAPVTALARERTSQPEAKPLRLFIAADVPDDVKGGLADAIGGFRARVPAARWTREESWHVTLKFLGTTWPRLLDDIRSAVTTAVSEARVFTTMLTEVGVFASPARTRVIWAGLADPEHRFAAVAGRLDALLEEYFVPENRELTPHLTLARINPPRNIREFAPELVGLSVASREFPVDSLVLYQSHLSPRGATYEALERFPFGA